MFSSSKACDYPLVKGLGGDKKTTGTLWTYSFWGQYLVFSVFVFVFNILLFVSCGILTLSYNF